MILEQEPENMDTINEIFRAAHSLKGMAGTMGYKRMQRLTHDMENVFQEIRSGNMKVQPELIDVLFRGLDALAVYLYLREYGKSGNPLHLRGLFSLFYVGGEGISCLKLSRLQTEWSLETWACFFVAFAAFWNVYELAEKRFSRKKIFLVSRYIYKKHVF